MDVDSIRSMRSLCVARAPILHRYFRTYGKLLELASEIGFTLADSCNTALRFLLRNAKYVTLVMLGKNHSFSALASQLRFQLA